MKKASMILGIVGGIIAILVALLSLLGSAVFRSIGPAFDEDTPIKYEEFDEYENTVMNQVASNTFLGFGATVLIAGILGLVGAAKVNQNNVSAGIMMIIASIISLLSFWGIFSFLLFLLGGIFALVNDKSDINSKMKYYSSSNGPI